EDSILQLFVVAFHDIEVQVYGIAVLVGMQDLSDLAADVRDDSQLFFELASQSLGGGFAGLNLAAGKLPFQGERLVLGSLTAQYIVATQDERGHNLLGQNRNLSVMRSLDGGYHNGCSRQRPTRLAQCSMRRRSSAVKAAGEWLSISSSPT